MSLHDSGEKNHSVELTSFIVCELFTSSRNGTPVIIGPTHTFSYGDLPALLSFYITAGFFDVPPDGFDMHLFIEKTGNISNVSGKFISIEPEQVGYYDIFFPGPSSSNQESIPGSNAPNDLIPLSIQTSIQIVDFRIESEGQYAIKIFIDDDATPKGCFHFYVYCTKNRYCLN